MEDLIRRLEKNGCEMHGTMERFLNDEDFYLECLKMALYDNAFEELEKQLEDKNAIEAFNQAHTLKGLIANMGITPIYEQVVKIVEPLRAGNCEGLLEDYAAMMLVVDKFRGIVDAYETKK